MVGMLRSQADAGPIGQPQPGRVWAVYGGTSSPSRLQIRSTRPSLTDQAWRTCRHRKETL